GKTDRDQECDQVIAREWHLVTVTRNLAGRLPTSSAVPPRSAHPAYDTGDAVHRDLRAVGNAERRIFHAEHHRHAAFAREGGEMCRAAATSGPPARHAWQDVTEGRPRHTRHQHIARRHARQLALAIDDDRAPGRPADTGRMAIETRVLQPDLVGHLRRL